MQRAAVMLCFIVSLAVLGSFSRGAVISVGGSWQDAFGPVTVNIPASAPAQISIDAPNGQPLQCIWDFGDNTTASGVTPAHAYSSGGTLTVSLTGTGMTRIYWGTDTANEVAEVNEIPQISSTPVITSQVGAAYAYQVLANDPAGDPPSYWLIGPKDMAISADGLITWAPLSPGFFQIIVNVTDGRGGKVSQTYTLTVTVPGD